MLRTIYNKKLLKPYEKIRYLTIQLQLTYGNKLRLQIILIFANLVEFKILEA